MESADPGTFFRSTDFEGSTSAVDTAMSRLARDGLLTRVHRGLYWKGVRSRFGTGRPPALAVGVELARPGIRSQRGDACPGRVRREGFWVTELLRTVVSEAAAGGAVAIFKGGTSLSKAYRIVERFSADIDVLLVFATV